MKRKFKRIARQLRRSEYQAALVQYQAAKRRGDPVAAQHWLKLADMHLQVADRFKTGVHTKLMREIEYAEAQARAEKLAADKAASGRAKASTDAQTALDRYMAELDRRFDKGEIEFRR